MTEKINSNKQYDENSVTVLKGLEPVKKRPGMYTYTEDPTHIAEEVIDNATDEALAGYATELSVSLYSDNALEVADNGRGIPVGLHPEEGVSVLELVFTRLHAGGKFNKKEGGAYAFSGGLHGVGVSVTNALSVRLEVESKREGSIWGMAFAGGEVIEPLSKIGSAPQGESGTRVKLWPDPQYFASPCYVLDKLKNALRAKAVLLPGFKVNFRRLDSEGCVREEKSWCYKEGMQEYLSELLATSELLSPVAYFENYHENGEGASLALTFTSDSKAVKASYVNLIATPEGGMHETGLKQVLFTVVGNFIKLQGLLPRGLKLQSEDVFSHVSFVLSCRLLDPQFQGQTKEKLINRQGSKIIYQVLLDPLELWLNQNPNLAKEIAALTIKSAQERVRSAKKIEKRKGSGVAILPGKLTDCESEDIRENELFLVEGESAGGSTKMARDKYRQAILPLRGKVLNSFEVESDALFANSEIHDIAVAIGVDPHSLEDEIDLSTLRYGKIAILSDADVDGAHIQVLLLALFYRHFPKLILHGHIYLAQPPLFRIDIAKAGTKKPAYKCYALDENELGAKKKELDRQKRLYQVSRFKGLGEMNAEQLRDTTLDPDSRNLLQVSFDPNVKDTENMMNLLMGKKEAAQRRAWLEEKGDLAELDV